MCHYYPLRMYYTQALQYFKIWWALGLTLPPLGPSPLLLRPFGGPCSAWVPLG